MMSDPMVVKMSHVLESFYKYRPGHPVISNIFDPTSVCAPFDITFFLLKVIMYLRKVFLVGNTRTFVDGTFTHLSLLGSLSRDRGSSKQSLTFANSITTPIHATNKDLIREQGPRNEVAGKGVATQLGNPSGYNCGDW